MDPTKLLRVGQPVSNDGKLQWNIVPVAYYPLHAAAYATVILASDWLYFSRHGIKYSMAWHGMLCYAMLCCAVLCYTIITNYSTHACWI